MKKVFLFLLLAAFLAPPVKAEINPDYHLCGVYCSRTHGPMKPKPETKEPSLLELFLIVVF